MLNTFTGAINSNWSRAGNWSLGRVPTDIDGDTVIFHALTPNCTLDVADIKCNSINFTDYSNTITSTFGLRVAGSVTLSPTMLFAGTASWEFSSQGIFISNGVTFPYSLALTGSNTKTFNDDWAISGNLSLSGEQILNNNVIGSWAFEVDGDLSVAGLATGSMEIILTGSGTWSGPGHLGLGLTFDTGAGYTVLGEVGFGNVNSPDLIHLSGAITTTGSTLNLVGVTGATSGSCILDTSAIGWNDVKIGNDSTYTLPSALNILGTLIHETPDATFAGPWHFNAENYYGEQTSTLTLAVGPTYQINTDIKIWSDGSQTYTIESDTPATQANLVLTPGIVQFLTKVNVTDINSSGGDTGETYRGILSNTTDWTSL